MLFEDELHHNTALRYLYENSKVNAILVADETGHIVHLNEGFTLNYGYQLQDLTGKHGRVIFTDEDQKKGKPENEIETAKQKGFIRDRNYLVHRNGKPVWTDGETVLVKTNSGNTFLFKIVQNLQEQVALETFLDHAFEFSDNLLSTINEGILVVGKDKKVIRANDALLRYLEIAPEIPAGTDLLSLNNSIFSSPEFSKELEDTLQHRNGREHVYHFTTPSGVKKVFTARTALLSEGENAQVLVIFSDSTSSYEETIRLQLSEQRFRSLIENSPVASCLFTGRDMIVAVANETMIGYWGKGPDVIGRPLRKVLPELEGQPFLQLLDDVFTTGKTATFKDAPAVLVKDGVEDTYYFDFTYSALYDEHGNVYGVMDTAVDVTENVLARQRMEAVVKERTSELVSANKALIKSNKELVHFNQRLEEFAYAASHDLKEPIRKISVFNSQLQAKLQGRLNEIEQRLIGRINDSSARMNHLVDDLLSYSQITEWPPETELVDLNIEIQHVLDDLELYIENSGALVEVGQLPSVNGYSRQLRKLFQNVVGNSLKFTKQDATPHIKITAAIEEVEDAFYHRIDVADNGIGFEPQYQEKVFQIFARLHGKTDYQGTGAGLAIALKAAENHNGFIQARSSLGDGAVFRVFLPV